MLYEVLRWEEVVLLDGVGGLIHYFGMSSLRVLVEEWEMMMIEYTFEDMLIERWGSDGLEMSVLYSLIQFEMCESLVVELLALCNVVVLSLTARRFLKRRSFKFDFRLISCRADNKQTSKLT